MILSFKREWHKMLLMNPFALISKMKYFQTVFIPDPLTRIEHSIISSAYPGICFRNY